MSTWFMDAPYCTHHNLHRPVLADTKPLDTKALITKDHSCIWFLWNSRPFQKYLLLILSFCIFRTNKHPLKFSYFFFDGAKILLHLNSYLVVTYAKFKKKIIEPTNLSSNSATLVEKKFSDWNPVFCPVSGFCTSDGHIWKFLMQENSYCHINSFIKISGWSGV